MMTTHDDVFKLPVSVLDLTVRARKAVQLSGASTLGELCRRSPEDFFRTKCFGTTQLDDLQSALAVFGLSLREDRQERADKIDALWQEGYDFMEIFRAFRNDPEGNLDAPVTVLDLCLRTVEQLRSAGLPTVRSLCSLTAEEIRATPGLEIERADEVVSALQWHGLLASGVDA